MKLTVVQHARCATATQDSEALLRSTLSACSQGADVVVLPQPAWLSSADVQAIADSEALASGYPGVTVLVGSSPLALDVAESRGVALSHTPLGTTAALAGDECIDPLIARELAVAVPDAIILRPASESELQAEAMLERALAFSESVSGLIVVAEADGGDIGEPGHGGSAVVVLGAMAAEAMSGDEVLTVEVSTPVPQPGPRDPVPELVPILAQRFALHRGTRVPVDYPADVT